MGQYRKKPVVVEAVQLTSELKPHDLYSFLGDFDRLVVVGRDHVVIRTPEGDMRADDGDWIVRGVKDEIYPVKPDIFALTYEPVPNEGRSASGGGRDAAGEVREA